MNPVVTVLAIQRTTQLLTEDTLTYPIRVAINGWAKDAKELSFKDQVATLSMCPACMSVWVAAGVLLVSRWRVGRVLVRIMAGSGAALIVQGSIKRLER